MVLGDTLTALGRKTQARTAYQNALAIANRMEPNASADWVRQIQSKVAGSSAAD
jgi:predicted negative regulator of RcsB-dependent stress response